MKKRTIAIVSITLVLAILAVSVIATFPSYLFEEEKDLTVSNPSVQSDKITESVEGDDVGEVGGSDNGLEAVLPDVEPPETEDTATSSKNLETIASDSGAKLVVENAAFPNGTKFEVDKLGLFNKKYYQARNYVRDFASDYIIYEITAKKDGKDVNPIAVAKVVFDIPEDFDLELSEVYYVLPNGGIQKLDCVIDKTNRTATISFMQSGVYILLQRKKADTTDTSSNSTSTESQDNNSSNTSSEGESSTESTSSNESTNSSENSSSSTSSDNSSSTESDPLKETMDGWTPWY